MWNHVVRAVLAPALLCAFSAAHALEQDVDLQAPKAVCEAEEWRKIEASLDESAGGHHPAALKQLAHSYFCKKRARAMPHLMRAAPRLVRVVGIDSDGRDEASLSLATEAISPKEGSARNAFVAFAEGRDVKVSYDPDVSCIGTIVFRPVASGWLIVEVSENCC